MVSGFMSVYAVIKKSPIQCQVVVLGEPRKGNDIFSSNRFLSHIILRKRVFLCLFSTKCQIFMSWTNSVFSL